MPLIDNSNTPFKSRKGVLKKSGFFIELNETKEVYTDEKGIPVHFNTREEAELLIKNLNINGTAK